MRRGILIKILTLALLLAPGLTEAQVINEILYSPSTKQWVEIFNNTNSDIDLSQYKILDAGAATNGHTVSASVTGGSTILPAGAYGVVAKDVTSVSATYLFKASLGVRTSGDTVTLKKSTNVVDTSTFTDTASSGNSLQRFDSGWAESTPTPGAVNVLVSPGTGSAASSTATSTDTTSSTTPSTETATASTGLSAHYSFVPVQNDMSQKFSVSVGRERLGTTGQALTFKAVPNTSDLNISYFWNFGDGSTGQGKEIHHTYVLAGDYTVVLNATLFDSDAVSRTRVKVVDPDLVVTESTPEYTAVKNKAKYEMNLYGWQLTSNGKFFIFPKDTIIGAGETVKFAAAITKIAGSALITKVEKTHTEEPVRATQPVSTSTPIASHADPEKVQAIADRIVSLNLELFAMENPNYHQGEVRAAPDTPPASVAPQVMAAAAVEALPATTPSWLTTLKHFFSR